MNSAFYSRTGHDMVGGCGGLTTKCSTTGGVRGDTFLLALLAPI